MRRLLIAFIAFMLVGCFPPPPDITPTVVEPSVTPSQEPTQTPTATPEPTETPEPTPTATVGIPTPTPIASLEPGEACLTTDVLNVRYAPVVHPDTQVYTTYPYKLQIEADAVLFYLWTTEVNGNFWLCIEGDFFTRWTTTNGLIEEWRCTRWVAAVYNGTVLCDGL